MKKLNTRLLALALILSMVQGQIVYAGDVTKDTVSIEKESEETIAAVETFETESVKETEEETATETEKVIASTETEKIEDKDTEIEADSVTGETDKEDTKHESENASSEAEDEIEINQDNFPDENFRKYLIGLFGDTLSQSEIADTISMDVSGCNIVSLKGIEYFSALESLNCQNNKLTELDLTACPLLNAEVVETDEGVHILFAAEKINIDTCTISFSKGIFLYNGQAVEPAVIVMHGAVQLIEGVDYEVTYTNNSRGGDATVTISGIGNYTGKLEKKFTITVAVPKLTGIANTDRGVRVKWNAVAGAERYRVYRKTGTGKWEAVANVKTAEYTDTKAASGQKYTYTVRCLSDNEKSLISDYDKAGISFYYLNQPKVTVSNEADSVLVKWNKVSGADSYRVYRKSNDAEKWQRVTVIKGGNTTSWNDKAAAVNGRKYIYTVKAYKTVGKVDYDSSFVAGSINYYLSQPVIGSIKVLNTNTLQVNWEKNTQANGYQLQYATSSDFSNAASITCDGSSINGKINKLNEGTLYYIRIRAFKTENSKNYYSKWSLTKSARAAYKTRSAIVQLAQSWVGKNERDGSFKFIIDIYNTYLPHPRNYKLRYTDEWCAGTCSALAISLGYTNIIPVECSCRMIIQQAQGMGIWIENDAYVPLPGDFILYNWSDKGIGDNRSAPDHIGIVESVNKSAGTFTVIEGNYSEAVKRRVVRINGRYIRGFVSPKYDGNGSGLNISSTQLSTPKLSGVVNNNEGVKVSWQSVSGAGKYRVFRKNAAGGWSTIGETTAAGFTDKKVTSGTSYTYTVRCLSDDGKTYLSSYDKTGLATYYLAQPGVSAVSIASGVTVKWDQVKGADGYLVYRKTGDTASWSRVAQIKNGDTVSWKDTKATENGKKYIYTVRAYGAVNGKTYLSSYYSGSAVYFVRSSYDGFWEIGMSAERLNILDSCFAHRV